jgi:hypothetical protein
MANPGDGKDDLDFPAAPQRNLRLNLTSQGYFAISLANNHACGQGASRNQQHAPRFWDVCAAGEEMLLMPRPSLKKIGRWSRNCVLDNINWQSLKP